MQTRERDCGLAAGGARDSADAIMTIQEFVDDARKRIENIGLHFGFAHTDVGGNTYAASLESARGCYSQPLAEAMRYEDGRLWYSFDLRQPVLRPCRRVRP